jgi:hypothetical protein
MKKGLKEVVVNKEEGAHGDVFRIKFLATVLCVAAVALLLVGIGLKFTGNAIVQGTCGEVDSDNDGFNDLCDNCPVSYNPEQIDSDADGVGDACDNCVEVKNLDQVNSDGDLYGNACDNCADIPNEQVDSDRDDIGDECDNCFNKYNPEQEDRDADGLGDACETPVLYWEYGAASLLQDSAAGDLDGDGSAEVAAIEAEVADTTYVLYNNGTDYWNNTDMGTKVKIGDINGDGKNEVVTGVVEDCAFRATTEALTPCKRVWVKAFDGLGESAWAAQVMEEVVFAVVSDIALSDVNDDGVLDVVASVNYKKDVALVRVSDTMVYALSGVNGQQLWSNEDVDNIADMDSGNFDEANGDVVTIGRGSEALNTIHALDGANGEDLWSEEVSGAAVATGKLKGSLYYEVVAGIMGGSCSQDSVCSDYDNDNSGCAGHSPSCNWVHGEPVCDGVAPACSSLLQPVCEQVQGCSWQSYSCSGGGAGIASCNSYGHTSCDTAGLYCDWNWWYGSVWHCVNDMSPPTYYCANVTKVFPGDSSKCAASSCTLGPAKCAGTSAPCSSYGAEQCASVSGCYLKGTCEDNCELLSQQECGYGCTWNIEYNVSAYGGDGTLLWTYPVDSEVVDVATGDIDNDGMDEVVALTVGHAAVGTIYVLNEDGTLSWSNSNVVNYLAVQGDPELIKVADVDNDGFKDIIVGDAFGKVYAFDKDGGVIWAYETQNDGGSLSAQFFPVNSLGPVAVSDIEIADLNGDGVLDVVAVAENRVYALFTKIAVKGEMPGYNVTQTELQDGSTEVCVYNPEARKVFCVIVPEGETLDLSNASIDESVKKLEVRGVGAVKTVYFPDATSPLCVLDSEDLASLLEDDDCTDRGEFKLDCPGSAMDPFDNVMVSCALDGTTAVITPLDHSGIATSVLGVAVVSGGGGGGGSTGLMVEPAVEQEAPSSGGSVPTETPSAETPSGAAEPQLSPEQEKGNMLKSLSTILIVVGILVLVGAGIAITLWYKKRKQYQFQVYEQR